MLQASVVLWKSFTMTLENLILNIRLGIHTRFRERNSFSPSFCRGPRESFGKLKAGNQIFAKFLKSFTSTNKKIICKEL